MVSKLRKGWRQVLWDEKKPEWMTSSGVLVIETIFVCNQSVLFITYSSFRKVAATCMIVTALFSRTSSSHSLMSFRCRSIFRHDGPHLVRIRLTLDHRPVCDILAHRLTSIPALSFRTLACPSIQTPQIWNCTGNFLERWILLMLKTMPGTATVPNLSTAMNSSTLIGLFGRLADTVRLLYIPIFA